MSNRKQLGVSHQVGLHGTSADNRPWFLAGRIRQRDGKVSVRLGSRDGGFPCLKSINSSPASIERVRFAKRDLRSVSRQKAQII